MIYASWQKPVVNWALRNIGKRSLSLNQSAVQAARAMQALQNRTARWIATDALRELNSDKIQARLSKKKIPGEVTNDENHSLSFFCFEGSA